MCIKSKLAWFEKRKRKLKKDGKDYGDFVETRQIKFVQDYEDEEILKLTQIGCGKCEECRIAKANEWATRITEETKLHKENCFITLTYNNENLPRYKSLVKKELQDFFKRLRKKYGTGIRYYACGEYGPKGKRPHYHAIIFGWKPNDLKYFKENETKDIVYKSKELMKIWGKGFTTVGEANFKSAGYVARYVQKKAKMEYVGRKEAAEKKKAAEWARQDERYAMIAKTMGVDIREPEFSEMSRRGGIGIKAWENKKEIYKRNGGVPIKTEKGVIIKNLPNFFKQKWKEENRKEYLKFSDEKIENNKKKFKEKVEKTSLTNQQYINQTAEEKIEKFKRLKRNDI